MQSSKTAFGATLCVLGLFICSTSSAHDDGLTCHTHQRSWATIDFVEVSGAYGGDLLLRDKATLSHDAAFGPVIHRFDNLVAERHKDLDPNDVKQFRAAMTRFRNGAFLVSQILVRRELSTDEADKEALLRLGWQAYNVLIPADLSSFGNFRVSIENREAVTIELTALSKHLLTEGIPDSLVLLFETAAQGC